MSEQAKPNLQSLISATSRTRRARPIPTRQPSVAPTEDKPLESPLAKCVPERVTVKASGSARPSSTRLTFDQRRKLAELARRRIAELPYVNITEAFFTIYSTEEIKKLAVTEVVNVEQTGPGSVNDPQMGPTDNSSLCATCFQDIVNCPGHFGFITLPEPVPHPLLFREIIAVLNVVCNDCGGLLLTREEIKEQGILRYTGYNRLNALEKASIGLNCRREKSSDDRPCVPNPTYEPVKSKESKQILYERMGNGRKVEFIKTGQEILAIFDNISTEEAELMGYINGAHPRRLIMEVLMVIPPMARPPAIEDGKRISNPLTIMYIDIIRHVNNLKVALEVQEGKITEEKPTRGQKKSNKATDIQSLRTNLFLRLKHFINNTDGWSPQGGQPHVSIAELLRGKEGLIRQNIMAKRVDYSARTVLSPDPSLAFGQISIPKWMVPIMTPKVRVNRYNRDELQNLLEKGHITYITFSQKPSSENSPISQLAGIRTQAIEKYRNSYQLQEGDEVERWLQNGDIIISNRQPTLHKYSFMGYRAVIRDQKTFGLHLSYTTPLNADFDGDEGNIHILQAYDARAEAEGLMNVTNCLISSQSNKPTMGIVFNGPIAAMLMTQPDTTIHPGDFHDALSYMSQREQIASLEARMNKYKVPYIAPVEVGKQYYVLRNDQEIKLQPDQEGRYGIIYDDGSYEYPADDEIQSRAIYENHYTGRALFSALLPDDFHYDSPNNNVTIREGVLLNGILTKAHVGPERNSIIHIMAMNYPSQRVADFISDATHVFDRWLDDYGFSIGVSSCLIDDPNIQEEINKEVERARLMVSAIGTRPEDPLEAEKWEEQVLAYVGAPADKIGRKLKTTLPRENTLNVAAVSGAKGKVENLVQISAFLGQQHIGGKRPKKQMTFETRCLPWFSPDDESLESSGYCTSSFLKGLSPSEAYFHQMAGREGLMGTAVSTSETGFMHRKAVKTLQDIKSQYDGSVRNVDKTIFQYVYGDDGFASSRLQMVETKKGKFLSFIDLNNVTAQINSRYGFYE